jgi:hypothetical protein
LSALTRAAPAAARPSSPRSAAASARLAAPATTSGAALATAASASPAFVATSALGPQTAPTRAGTAPHCARRSASRGPAAASWASASEAWSASRAFPLLSRARRRGILGPEGLGRDICISVSSARDRRAYVGFPGQDAEDCEWRTHEQALPRRPHRREGRSCPPCPPRAARMLRPPRWRPLQLAVFTTRLCTTHPNHPGARRQAMPAPAPVSHPTRRLQGARLVPHAAPCRRVPRGRSCSGPAPCLLVLLLGHAS